ncbi:MAG: hypothetical protein EZS28_048844 [Streblomastix strix]|uniref:Uncharacterized protein n=1 Tax=Streblomastix strix TaxID=222440 RepID=A0A5J4TDF9_9EUKA|nr:MAG: hypothetical protein EZS28_048844 [Streblomastix strix]
MQFFLTGLFQVNLIIFHSRIWVLGLNSIVILVLVVLKLDQKAGWPAELGAGEVNKLDFYIYWTQSVAIYYSLKEVGLVRKGLVTENLKIAVYPGTFQIPGTAILVVSVSVVLSKIVVRSRLVQTSPAVESVILVPSQLRSIGLLAGQLGPDFLVLISISTHAMVNLRVT